MQRAKLEVTSREATGKGAMRRIRAEGGVPAAVYGSGSLGMNLRVDAHTLDQVISHGTNQLIDLKGAGKARLVLLKEIQRDPVSQALVHADFFQVDTEKKIHVSVPLHFEGRPYGVEMGGVLEPLFREVEVECLPLEIPDGFRLDVSPLDIGDSLHVSDLEVPAGVELLADSELAVIHVIAPRVVEEETEGEGEGEEGEGVEAAAAAEGAEAAPEDDAAEKASE